MIKIEKESVSFKEDEDDFVGEFYMIASHEKELIPVLKAITEQRKDIQKIKVMVSELDREMEEVMKRLQQNPKKRMKK